MENIDYAGRAGQIRSLLAEHGPLSEDDIADSLAAAGTLDPDVAADELAEVLEGCLPLGVTLPDGRWVWLPALLDGRVFTHRVDAREIAHDVLDTVPDLGPVSLLLADEDGVYDTLADGTECVEVFCGLDDDALDARGVPRDAVRPDGALLLAPGTLSRLGLSAGALVGVRVTQAGLALERVDDAQGSATAADLLAVTLASVRRGSPDLPELLDTLIWAACAAEPALFTVPGPPLAAAVESAGFALEGEWLAPHGFDFSAWRMEARTAAIGERYDLSADEALAVLATTTLFEQVARLVAGVIDSDPDTAADPSLWTGPDVTQARTPDSSVRAALSLLDEPAVAGAVLAEIGTGDRRTAAALGIFAESLEAQAPRRAQVAMRWLQAKAAEALGDVAAAEEHYRAAEAMNPAWGPVLVELARFASDRGDAERGLSLLRRADVPPEDGFPTLLAHFRPPPPRALGRNAPCWCGSGRKYKQCHLHREQLQLEERAAWLYQKAAMALSDDAHSPAVVEVAIERSRYDESPTAVLTALDEGLVGDVVLFEGGAFQDFLDQRGFLLPEDEFLLGHQWLLTERSVHEVTAVRAGDGFTVRDLRTGDTHEVRERTASRRLRPGTMICARVVPAGSTMQIFGAMETVSLGEREELIALLDAQPDPVELVAFLSRRRAPTRMQNTEGDPLVLCEAVVRVEDGEALAAALTGEFGEPEYEDPDAEVTARRWHEQVVTHGMPRVRATLTLSGVELRVETNSEARQDCALATVRRLAPASVVVSDTRRPSRDEREFARLSESFPTPTDTGVLDPDDPEIAAAMETLIRRYETAWLDEPVPALGGRTPRDCVADPTRRADVERLLDTFPTSPGGMNADRLRAALGLR